MKKIFIAFVAAVSLVFTGCDLEEKVYEEPNYITFDRTSEDVSVPQDGATSLDLTVYISNMSGSSRTYDLVVEESSTLSAQAFEIPSSLTVDGDSNEVSFTINFTDSGISNSGDVLVLGFKQGDGLYVSDPLEISVLRDCPSELEGTYYYESIGTGTPVVITNTGGKNYSVSRDNQFGTAYAFTIRDVCDNITVTGGDIPDNFDIPNSGSGTVDPNTGEITIYYTVDGYFSDAEMVLIPMQ